MAIQFAALRRFEGVDNLINSSFLILLTDTIDNGICPTRI